MNLKSEPSAAGNTCCGVPRPETLNELRADDLDVRASHTQVASNGTKEALGLSSPKTCLFLAARLVIKTFRLKSSIARKF